MGGKKIRNKKTGLYFLKVRNSIIKKDGVYQKIIDWDDEKGRIFYQDDYAGIEKAIKRITENDKPSELFPYPVITTVRREDIEIVDEV